MYKDALKKYLDDLASRKPAPGGGSAAALTAATGVSLISMVANFTVGKDKYKDFEDEARQVLSSSEALGEELIKLVDEDVRGYGELSRAYKLPKESCEDKRKRAQAIQEGLREALASPLGVCRCSHEAIKLCLPLAQKGNSNLITDVAIAAMFLECAFQSALLNVEINLKSINDDKFILEVREILDPMETELGSLNQEVKSEVEGRMAVK